MVEEWVSLREFARRRGVSLQAVQKAIASGRVTAVRRADPGPDGQPGRITGIEVAAATAQWNRNTDPNEAAKSGKVIPAPDAQASEVLASPAAPIATTAQPSLLDPTPMVAGAPETPGAPAGGSDDQAPGTRPADATPNPAPETVAAAAVGLNAEPTPDAVPPDAPANSEYYAHRAKREEFSAKTAELEYFQKIGVLVPAAGVRKAAFDAGRQLRDKLLGIPDRVAPLLAAERDPVRVHAALTTEITRTLHELTRRTAAPGGPGLSE